MQPYISKKIKVISFLSILLVVFLHAYNLDPGDGTTLFFKSKQWIIQDFISYGITRIAVPLFFVISGFLFFLNIDASANVFKQKIQKRIRTLFVPFIFWSLAGIAFYFSLQSLPQTQVFFSKGLVRDFTVRQWFETIFIHPIPYQFWFIRDLMVLVLLSPLLYYCVKKLGSVFLIIPLLLWVLNLGEWNNSAEALLFFSLGAYLGIHKSYWVEQKTATKTVAFFLFALWILLLILKTVSLYTQMPQEYSRLLLKASIVTGIFAFWFGYDHCIGAKQRMVERLLAISIYTFFIYAFHEPLLTIYKKVLLVVFAKHAQAYLYAFILAPVFAILTALSVGFLLKKWTPRFYGTITGGR